MNRVVVSCVLPVHRGIGLRANQQPKGGWGERNGCTSGQVVGRPQGRNAVPTERPLGARKGSPGEVRRSRGPRGDRSCDAAKTTRGLRSSSAVVTPLRYGPRVLDPLLDDLDDEQRAAVASPQLPLAIVAPAGSGKTRVLTRRIAYRVREGADARHVLALTFTRKAAGELVERLGAGTAVRAGTFHAIPLRQLRERGEARGQPLAPLLTRKARLVAPLLGRTRPDVVADVVAEIEWAQVRMIRPDEYEAAARAS